MPKNPIVVVGSCMVDFVCYSSRLPKPGETIHGHSFHSRLGGKGANQCVAARKLGGDVTMIARVGDDEWGDRYIRHFKCLGVHADSVKLAPRVTNGIAHICVADTGDNQIIIVAGANSKLSVEDVNEAKSTIENAEVVVCQLETSVEVAMAALRLAKGVTILNAAPAIEKYDSTLITLPTILCVNESEAALLSELTIKTIEDAKIAVRYFKDKGCQCVIITMGAQGAVFADKDGIAVHVESPAVESVDSTGAGDAFVGCLAYLLANRKKMPLKSCVEVACFIAGRSCTIQGTQSSYADGEVLNQYLQQGKYSSYV